MGGANALTWDRSANEMAMNDRVVVMVGVRGWGESGSFY